MFYSAQTALLTKDLSYSSHKGVISGSGEHFIKTGIFPREMVKEFNRAFQKRQIGDYEFTFVVSKVETEQIIRSAKQFIDKIDCWLTKK